MIEIRGYRTPQRTGRMSAVTLAESLVGQKPYTAPTNTAFRRWVMREVQTPDETTNRLIAATLARQLSDVEKFRLQVQIPAGLLDRFLGTMYRRLIADVLIEPAGVCRRKAVVALNEVRASGEFRFLHP